MVHDARTALVASIVLASLALGATAQSLTAGDVDDHLNWDEYLGYVGRLGQDVPDLPGLAFSDRATLRVEDADGEPVRDARVTVSTQSGSVTLRSGGDGLVRVLPREDGLGPAGDATVRVEAGGADATFQVDLRASGVQDLAVDAPSGNATALDLMFVIDTTGSMGDELSYLTNELEGIVAAVRNDHPGVDLRYGLTVYRDHGDDYVVRSLGFTDDLQTMQSRIAAQSAGGGGDYPEAMDEALRAAVDDDWRGDGTARVLVLVADAPPHPQGYGAFLEAARDARRAGIHVHPLAASGVGDAAEYLMRAAAVMTQGRYLFLTDDSGVGNAHAEPSIPCYVVTSLSGLLVRVVASEITGERVEPDGQEVLREAGDYDRGVCLGDPDPQQQDGGDHGDGSSSDVASGEASSSPSDGGSDDSGVADGGDDGGGDADRGDGGGREADGDAIGLEDGGGSGDADTPGPAPWMLLAALAVAAVALRRRT